MYLCDLQYPVNWQPDMDNNVLIGQMVLRKNQSEACTHQDSSAILGLKVIGGKMKEAGRLGAFISKVKRGSIADTVGHLRAGQFIYNFYLSCIFNERIVFFSATICIENYPDVFFTHFFLNHIIFCQDLPISFC